METMQSIPRCAVSFLYQTVLAFLRRASNTSLLEFLYSCSNRQAKTTTDRAESFRIQETGSLTLDGKSLIVGPSKVKGVGCFLAAGATGGSAARFEREVVHRMSYAQARLRWIESPCTSISSYPFWSTYVSPTRSLSLGPVIPSELY